MRQGKDGITPVLTDDQFSRLKEEMDANTAAAHERRTARSCSIPPSNGSRCR